MNNWIEINQLVGTPVEFLLGQLSFNLKIVVILLVYKRKMKAKKVRMMVVIVGIESFLLANFVHPMLNMN